MNNPDDPETALTPALKLDCDDQISQSINTVVFRGSATPTKTNFTTSKDTVKFQNEQALSRTPRNQQSAFKLIKNAPDLESKQTPLRIQSETGLNAYENLF